ncbi:MAG: transcriptional repressor [Alphaproteobacteria bacterium]|jgi:Fur family peroxide stress response transcriptional regulator|nr:transcriptional repressor [Alphaproteobacteria bacterium]
MKAKNYSKKREAILEKIRTATCHPTAEWIFQELKEDFPDLSLATVYRNITLFKEERIISSVGNIQGQEHFDGIMQPHGHFICEKCQKIRDITFSNIQPELIKYLEGIQDSKVEHIDLTVRGICKNCLDAK